MPAPAYLTELHDAARRAASAAAADNHPDTETIRMIASLSGRLVEAAARTTGGAQ